MLDRLFTPAERSAADTRGADRRWERLAGLFAAKEAALKALGTGMAVAFRDVHVAHDGRGRPLLHLTGKAEAAARRIGAHRWHVSISHSGGFAVATVVADGPDARGGREADGHAGSTVPRPPGAAAAGPDAHSPAP